MILDTTTLFKAKMKLCFYLSKANRYAVNFSGDVGQQVGFK